MQSTINDVVPNEMDDDSIISNQMDSFKKTNSRTTKTTINQQLNSNQINENNKKRSELFTQPQPKPKTNQNDDEIFASEMISKEPENNKSRIQIISENTIDNNQYQHIKIISKSPMRQTQKTDQQRKAEQYLQQDSYRDVNIKCDICQETNTNEIIQAECNHNYHVECFKQIIQKKENNYKKCPLCKSYLHLRVDTLMEDSFNINLIQEIMQQEFTRLSFCLNSQCQYAFIFNEKMPHQNQCPQCLNLYCLNCLLIIKNSKDHKCKSQSTRSTLHFKFCNECKTLNEFNLQEYISQQKRCQKCKKIFTINK